MPMGASRMVSQECIRYENFLNHRRPDLTTKAISHEELSNLTTQNKLATAWSSLVPEYPQENIYVLPSIEHAISQIKKLHGGTCLMKVLVTGSLHLVGGVLEVADLSEIAL